MPVIATFYHFAPLPDPAATAADLRALCGQLGVTGTAILACEGVNGTLAGDAKALAQVRGHLTGLPGFADLRWQVARADTAPFRRLKVKVKPEVVTLWTAATPAANPAANPAADPARNTGLHVAPQDWNALISAPDVVLIDTRNAYEVAVGRFAGASDPGTAAFSDFPSWWQAQGDAVAGKRLAMYCTGGIRCEKAGAWLRGQGVAQVYQLDGGIVAYLAQVPPQDSLWRGECFVFDDRVTVGHGQVPGRHRLCAACGWAVPPGAACGHCGAAG